MNLEQDYMHYRLNFLLVLQLSTASSAFSFLLNVTIPLVQAVQVHLPLNLYKLPNNADCYRIYTEDFSHLSDTCDLIVCFFFVFFNFFY